MAEEKGKEKTEAEEEGEEMWVKVVEMTQTDFRDGKLAEEATWQTVVLIPKGKGGVLGNWTGGGDLETHDSHPPPPDNDGNTVP